MKHFLLSFGIALTLWACAENGPRPVVQAPKAPPAATDSNRAADDRGDICVKTLTRLQAN